jgi:hypothetical protein
MAQFDFASAITHITNLIEVAILQAFLCALFAIKLWKLLKKEFESDVRPCQADTFQHRFSGKDERSP